MVGTFNIITSYHDLREFAKTVYMIKGIRERDWQTERRTR